MSTRYSATDLYSNASSLAASRLAADPTRLNANVQLRNNMQKVYGEKTTMTTAGVDLESLRQKMRGGKRPGFNSNSSNTTYVIDTTSPWTPPTSNSINGQFLVANSALAVTGSRRDDRFYRNKLSKDPIRPTSLATKMDSMDLSYKTPPSNLKDDDDYIEVVSAMSKSTPEMLKRGRKRANKQ
jgi:hypothetical protein